jgi:hypothetical protein
VSRGSETKASAFNKIIIKLLHRYFSPTKKETDKIKDMKTMRIYWDYYFANLDKLFLKVCVAGVY